MEPADLDTETYDTIPWSHLAPARTPLLTRVAAGVVGLGAAAALTFVLVTVLRGEPAGVVVPIPGANGASPPATASVSPPTATEPPPVPAVADPASPPEAGLLFTEADLMAVIPEEEQRLAATYAAWFVTDFFTVDGDALAAERVRAMLPAGLDVELPHDAPTGVSYVEWASALAVRPDGPLGYSVDIAFRTLTGPGDGSLVRQPVRAVRVPIHVVDAGAVAVGDLPEPIVVPIAVSEFSAPPGAEPSPEVGAAAIETSSAFGSAGELVGAGLDEAGWRLQVMVRDASGMEFPFAIRP